MEEEWPMAPFALVFYINCFDITVESMLFLQKTVNEMWMPGYPVSSLYSLTYIDVIQKTQNYNCACNLPSGNSGFPFEPIHHECASQAAGKEKMTEVFNVSLYNICILSKFMMILVRKTYLLLFTWTWKRRNIDGLIFLKYGTNVELLEVVISECFILVNKM
jgi:hypothetical protein